MFHIYYQLGRSRKKQHVVHGLSCTVGSGRGSDLVLASRHVSKRHAEFELGSGGLYVRDLGSTQGLYINHGRVQEYGPLSDLDEIMIGDVAVSVDAPAVEVTAKPAEALQAAAVPGSHAGLLFRTALSAVPTLQAGTSPTIPAEADGDANRQLRYWTKVVHEHLLQRMDIQRRDINRMSDEQLKSESANFVRTILAELDGEIPDSIDQIQLAQSVINEAVGLGPLEDFLADESITEIMVNSHDDIFVERNGRIEKTPSNFSSDAVVKSVIDRIITPIGRRIDESSPIVDARLKDGSRVNAVIPPLALKGPSITIRKFPKHRLGFTDLVQYGSLDQHMVEFLRVAVEQRKNIVVAGGTGSGKTTLLNVLSSFIPASDRIVTIEDAAELKLAQPNIVSLEARPANAEGRGGVAIRELVKNSLRMRPDRIVVGECRGGEALDMLQAMNTGHDGSLTTVHANSPRDVVSRLEVLVLMAGVDLPVQAVREQIASSIDLVIQQTRFACGSRKITQITEVVGMESGTIQLQDIFRFRQRGQGADGKIAGAFKATGNIPTFYEELREMGIELSLEPFVQEVSRVIQ